MDEKGQKEVWSLMKKSPHLFPLGVGDEKVVDCIEQTELHEERGKHMRAEAKARKLDQQLKYARTNKFGDKCQMGLARKKKQTGRE